MALTHEEISRYSRHLILPEVGPKGQEKLKSAKVLMVGTGGLGSPIGLYLAAAGVGTLGIIDFDTVDASNLQRQIIHGTKDVGRLKVESAKEKILDINPNTRVVAYNERLTSKNITQILNEYDFIVDGTDNFPTRYLVNDACVFAKKAFVYGSIFRFEGQATVFFPGKGPCYRCLFEEPPPPGMVPSCAEGGVLGVLPALIGSVQATEAVKLILGRGDPLIGRLLIYDALKMRFREVRIRPNKDCIVCGEHPTVKELIDYEAFCGIQPPLEIETREDDRIPAITAVELKALIDGKKPIVILDVREEHEYEICNIPQARLIPLSALPERSGELNPEDDIIVHCHRGIRSKKAIQYLQEVGFQKLRNLTGGIHAWSTDADPECPQY